MESKWYLLRHLGAREPVFMGEFKQIPGASPGTEAVYGFGTHPDGGAHLLAKDYVIAEGIGERLPVPNNIEKILLAPSPLVRADETNRHVFVGMCRNYAKNDLGLTEEDMATTEGKRILTQKGLHKYAGFRFASGLAESAYKNGEGEEDEGKELINQCHCKEINDGTFPGYRWIVQKGIEGDTRSEHPQEVATRGFNDILPELTRYGLVLSTSHQPNVEIIAAALSGDLGRDANEIWDGAGGDFALGGGFMLTTQYNPKSGLFESAQLRRTPQKTVADFSQELPVSLNVLNSFL